MTRDNIKCQQVNKMKTFIEIRSYVHTAGKTSHSNDNYVRAEKRQIDVS